MCSWLPNKTDAYFPDFVFVMTNIKVTNDKYQSYKYEKHSREICRSRCPLRRVPHLGFKTFTSEHFCTETFFRYQFFPIPVPLPPKSPTLVKLLLLLNIFVCFLFFQCYIICMCWCVCAVCLQIFCVSKYLYFASEAKQGWWVVSRCTKCRKCTGDETISLAIHISLSLWHHLEKSKKCNKNDQFARILNRRFKMQILCVPKALKKGVSERT